MVASELTRWAGEEAQRREAVKKQAMHYATDPLAGKEAAAVKRCLGVLRQAADKASFLSGGPGASTPRGSTRGGGAGSHQQQLNLVDTLGALRWGCAGAAGACASKGQAAGEARRRAWLTAVPRPAPPRRRPTPPAGSWPICTPR